MGVGDMEDDETGRKRKAESLIDDEPLDGDEMEEDDEDDVEPTQGRFNRRVVRFIDEEVAVDDDIEEDEEEEADFSEEDLVHEAAEAAAEPSHYRRYEAARDLPEDVDDWEAYIKERYQTVEYATDATAANQQSLLPTHLDPKLWVVQCRPGYERSLCLHLMNKVFSFRSKGNALNIKSAVSLDHLKGYLYVEAEKEMHVREAISGMRHIQHTKGVKLVPLGEMVSAITPNRVAKLPIEVGSWVRVRSGPYAHDLAKVTHVNHAQQKVDLKVVPRIDYTELLNRQEGRYLSRSRDPFGKKSKVRPIAKPFSSEECRSLGLVVERRRGVNGEVFMCVGNYLFLDGYLIKTMAMRSIIVEDSVPPIEELHKFDAASHAHTELHTTPDGHPDMSESIGNKKHGLFKGDSVRVLAGDMMSMTGVVSDIAADGRIFVKMDSHDVTGPIPFNPIDLVKRFDLGDHVCVREGMRAGQLGMVIKIEHRKCLILADLDKSEFWAAAKDLSRTQGTSFGYDQFGDYEIEDLVELQHRQYGVIVFADRDFCSVLLAAGTPEKPELKKATLQEIKCKCESRRNATNDRHGCRIGGGDIVDFTMSTTGQKCSGTVKYISPPYVFAKIKGRTEYLGYIAINSKLCTVRGGFRPAAPDPMMGLRTPGPGAMDWGRQERASYGGRFGRGRYFLRGRGRGRGAQRETVMVKVIKGAHRGYRGRIKDETATHVRVELDAGSRIMTLPKDYVECLEPEFSSSYAAPVANSGFGWEDEKETGSNYGAPKTPYGDNHPPTTPYIGNRDEMTSPKYTVRPVAEPEGVMKEDSDSDAEMRFGDAPPASIHVKPETVEPRPKSPVPPPSPQPPAEPPAATLAVDNALDLASLPTSRLTGLVVQMATGGLGIVREVAESGDLCQIEVLSVNDAAEHRVLTPTGEKQRQSLDVLKLAEVQSGDWVKVMQGIFIDSVGPLIAVDGSDCVTRLGNDEIQIFPRHTIAVTLPHPKSS